MTAMLCIVIDNSEMKQFPSMTEDLVLPYIIFVSYIKWVGVYDDVKNDEVISKMIRHI